MSLESIKNAVMSKTARQVLLTKKHSPKILFAAGAVGIVGTVVLACRATLKMNDVLEQHEKALVEVDAVVSERSDVSTDTVTKAKHKLQIKTGLDIAKLYAPAVGLGVVSIAALTGSHIILDKRNGAVMAAYAGLDKAYKEYRKRVADTYGEDVDRKFGTGAVGVVVEEKMSDGTTQTRVAPGNMQGGKFGGSPYAVVFDEQSRHFSKEPGRNAEIIQIKQSYANDLLRMRGHLFLNEVLDMLGLPRTKAGAVVGWIQDEDNPDHKGDNYVDFGVFRGEKEWVDAFIDGDEKYATLDFNVDGVIYDKI